MELRIKNSGKVQTLLFKGAGTFGEALRQMLASQSTTSRPLAQRLLDLFLVQWMRKD